MMKTAWHVDDDEEMITAITLMMRLLDFKVRPFFNAPAASKALQAGERPDLLLLDINMPQVSGLDMLEFVRRSSEFSNLPVVMLTSEFTDSQAEEAFALGADAYVIKPATLDELSAAVNQALGRNGK